VSFPALLDYVSQAAVLPIGVPIVYLLSRVLRVRPKPIAFPDPKREATHALWMIVPFVAVMAVWRTFVYLIYTPAFQLSNQHYLNGGQTVDMYDLMAYLTVYSVVILLLVLLMKRTGQKLGSIGITRANFGRMLSLGFSLGVILLFITGSTNSFQFTSSPSSLLYGLVLLSMAAFAEEVIWRGYIQTRLIARIGKLKGLLVTALLFAFLWHFPVAYYTQATGNVLGVFAYASERFFPGLLFGYIMIRCQNIIPSSIFHLFLDWSSILWR